MICDRRRVLAAAITLAACLSCTTGNLALERGSLGPASYAVEVRVGGPATFEDQVVKAILDVAHRVDGASIALSVDGEEPVVAELKSDGRALVLDTLQRVPPTSAGEADLASLVSQLDPPLPSGPVRFRRPWTQRRSITTSTLQAWMDTTLRIARFDRLHGVDVAVLEGSLTGELSDAGTSRQRNGAMRGTTSISWDIERGRLVASTTRIVWSIAGAGEVEVLTRIRPL